ncbi:MAG: hypothetical protein K2W96_16410, partial [Gemmataceae bacterium]|nr:hypothetical protein [Gemmataceae bacterium]
MSTATALLEQAMDDDAAALVLADWLEERGEDARAAAVRRCVAGDELKHAPWMGSALVPLLEHLPLAGMGKALLPFLVAPVAEADGDLPGGSEWRGNLWQGGRAVPTRLALGRTANRVAGTLREDFTRLYGGIAADGTFHFAGVAVGRVLAFVTHRVEGDGIHPGLYLLRLGKGG